MKSLKFNPNTGRSIILPLDNIAWIEGDSRSITIHSGVMPAPIEFAMDIDDFVARVYSDTGIEYELIELDEDEEATPEDFDPSKLEF